MPIDLPCVRSIAKYELPGRVRLEFSINCPKSTVTCFLWRKFGRRQVSLLDVSLPKNNVRLKTSKLAANFGTLSYMKQVTNRSLNLRLMAVCLIFVSATFAGNAAATERAECFPFESLPTEKRLKAEALLLKALDSEALYTIVGGIKPMSSGFVNFNFPVREPRQDEARKQHAATLASIRETREMLSLWRCGGEVFSEVQHFSRVFEGKRFAEGVVFNSTAMRRMLGERSAFFSRWGITPESHPLTVLYAVENANATPRFAGYGYLFGYPEYAVRFFVEAANEEEFTGKFVERDFYSIGTFAEETNRFVYAVPKGHKEREEDAKLKARAQELLAEYKTRRARFIGEGKAGPVELLRDWFCDEAGRCDPSRTYR